MSFKIRTLASTIHRVTTLFPALLLTGPRQVGKSTLLGACANNSRTVVSLDDMELRTLAKNDPALFLQKYKPPIIIDEVQYAPELFNVIKQIIDNSHQPGLFWLTGSQKFHLMSGISETLAGRIAILDLLGFSRAEMTSRAETVQPFLPTQSWLSHAQAQSPATMDLMEVYTMIWRGSFPRLITGDDSARDIFYNSYIQTYIQRDVRALARVGDEMAFMQFLRVAAARTGQLINYASMARDVGVDLKTVKSWLSILETSGIIYLLQPFHNNITNRMIKSPKLYFLDTGLCAYLTQWTTPETLEAGAMSGAFLETYVITEILKSYWHNGKMPMLYFYRDKDQKEIDLLIEQDGKLYPIEIKKTARPSLHADKYFSVLDKLSFNIGPGAVLCLKQQDVPLSSRVTAIPIGYL